MTQYTWIEGAHANGISAQSAGDELERIRVKSNGLMTPRAVVDESRPDEAPLHPVFEWDDTVAAEAWREEQARYVIRSVAVVYEEAPQHGPTRAFVSVERERRPIYTSTAVALSDAEMRQQVLQRALGELASWRKRYADLSELAKVFAAIDKVATKVA